MQTAGISLVEENSPQTPPQLKYYRLQMPANTRSIEIRYSGKLETLITPNSAFLNGNDYWYPSFKGNLLRFSLTLKLPAGWHGVSQGVDKKLTQESKWDIIWEETTPQDQIYLLAAPYHVYRSPGTVAEAQVYLLREDAGLAARYLEATANYLELYQNLLGPYLYGKFALVENSRQTGYGMPSFTLLGSRVIRLPFILYTSYPHEILHNWWGNGVYVNHNGGNWGEGMTSYLADHLLKEQRGKGAEHRRAALQKYADFVARKKDFPLTEFRGRHGEISQAIGYHKTMMFLHMLRRKLGDRQFLEGLRMFYRDNLSRRASFTDLRNSMERISGYDLKSMFKQWVERTGAPSLELQGFRVTKGEKNGYHIQGTLLQTQPEAVYSLDVPLAITLEGREDAFQANISMDDKREIFKLSLPAKPLRIDADPQFDLFRRLHRQEIPSSLGQLFGSDATLFVLPATAPEEELQAWRQLAQAWAGKQAEIILDNAMVELPKDRSLWILGWNNRLRSKLDLRRLEVTSTDTTLTLGGKTVTDETHSVVLALHNPNNTRHNLAWIGADNLAAIPGLARKLPHYSRYSYLAFTGTQPTNTIKGQWPVLNSPLTFFSDPSAPARRAKLAPRQALTGTPSR